MSSISSAPTWQAIPCGSEACLDDIAEQARLDERRRIARDLHDDVLQQLALLVVDLDLLREQTGAWHSDMLRERLNVVMARGNAIASTVRNVAHELKDSGLGDLGLALHRLCEEHRTLHHIDLRCICDGFLPSVQGRLALALYRIVQEALHNVLKRSGARRATVEIAGHSDAVVLRIVDDGCGFDVEATEGKGIGLANMRERLEPFNGRLSISSAPWRGTRIEVFVPIRSVAAA
jgi:signal transduction histidine kinase